MIETKNDILHVGGIPITDLAKKYSDPFYVYDGDAIEQKMRDLRLLLPRQVEIIYSMKANPNASLVALFGELADGLDVSSGRELQVALWSGVSPDRIFFVGPSKSEQEIEEAVRSRIGCLIVESERELGHANRIAERLRLSVQVALRINPAFDAVGAKLKMGGTARQFGIDEERIEQVVHASESLAAISLIGLHAYVGTRILDWNTAVTNTREILGLALRVHQLTGLQLKFVDIGGGFGVAYFPGEHPFDLQRFAQEARPVVEDFSRLMPDTRIVMELGRFLVAEAGVYVTQVRYTKNSRGQKFALVSGGMNHHQATTSIGSIVKNHFPIKILNKVERPAEENVFVCGPLCTPGDVLGRMVHLPLVEEGDLIGILNSGAYGMTASPLEFISHSWPREILVYRGTDYLVRRAPDLEEVLKYQPLAALRSYTAA
jgi:diaminopimelate decarboxylase